MKIVLSGVETNNKGAELMLYAILQEIERKHPDAIVYISGKKISQGVKYIKTKLDFRFIPFETFEQKMYLASIYAKLKLSFRLLPHMVALGRVDYFIDGSGFRFSDQFTLSNHYAAILESLLSAYRKKGTKIIYLPQAFGPFEKKTSRDVLTVLSNYATLLIPREKVSLNYLKASGLVDMSKVKMFTDFTSLVEGIFPSKYEHLRNGICIIPNLQMINKGAITMDDYLSLLKSIIDSAKKSGRVVYLLNHEGTKDEMLCEDLRMKLSEAIDCVSGLNALEVKGMIASAYMVITSRFHGLASSLNSGVPSLATSWSHKYEELFKDYGLDGNYVLPLNDKEAALEKVKSLLEPQKNKEVRCLIERLVPEVKAQTREMWNVVWN